MSSKSQPDNPDSPFVDRLSRPLGAPDLDGIRPKGEVMSSRTFSQEKIDRDDRGKRVRVVTGWAQGRCGVVAEKQTGVPRPYFTVQLDDGSRFMSLPGEVESE